MNSNKTYASKEYDYTFEDMVTSALADIQELFDEIDSWHGKMVGTYLVKIKKFGKLEKCKAVLQNVLDYLPNVTDSKVLHFAGEVGVKVSLKVPTRKDYTVSRDMRLRNACRFLAAAAAHLTYNLETKDCPAKLMERVQKYIDDLESSAAEAENVVFPTLFD